MIHQFDFSSNDLGLVISGHGVLVSFCTLFIFPKVNRLFGSLYWTWMCGITLILVGYSLVGLMQEWWSFMLIMSPLAGWGFSFMMNSMSPLQDQWCTPVSR